MKYVCGAALLCVALAASAAAQPTPEEEAARLAAREAYVAAHPAVCPAPPPAPELVDGASADQAQINAANTAFNAWAAQIDQARACWRTDAENHSYLARARNSERYRVEEAYAALCLAWLPQLNAGMERFPRQYGPVPEGQRDPAAYCRMPSSPPALPEPTDAQRAFVAANPSSCQALLPQPELVDGARANVRQIQAAHARVLEWDADAAAKRICWRDETANQSHLADLRVGEHNAILATFRQTCEGWIGELNEFRARHNQAIPAEHRDVAAFCRGVRPQ
jgi:hypothetical protein